MRFRSDSRVVRGCRLCAVLGITLLVAIGAYADNANKTRRAAPTFGTVGDVGTASRQASGGACPTSSCPDNILTQSLDPVTDGANQVACGTGGNTTENSWARCFDLVSEGFAGVTTINSVTFGVQQATIDDIPLIVNLYLDLDGCPASGRGTANAPLLASETLVVGPADEGTMITVNFPGTEVAAGSSLIVELEATADGTLEPLHAFRAMSNDAGQCGGSFLFSVSCGDSDWNDLADIGFPDAHLILNIDATAECGPVAECGDGVQEGNFEECDGDDDANCAIPGMGLCLPDCTCAAIGACCDSGGKVGGCDENLTQGECEGQAGGGNWIGEGSICPLCACAAAEGNPDLDCLLDHGEPGCNDFACCVIVCENDPFCCEGEWDFTCVDNATTNCPFPPDNDNCEDSIPIFDGLTEYDTTDANTDGLEVPEGLCNDVGETQVNHDIWFDYLATCTGALLVTTCEEEGGSSTYDSDLALYYAGGDDCGLIPCPPGNDLLIGCNDDDLLNPCGGVFHSTIRNVAVVEGDCYKVRVGGWAAGSQGAAELLIECEAVTCGDGSCHALEDCIGCQADCGVCPDPTGACCLTALGAECIVQTEAGCRKVGGDYLGDDAECTFGKGDIEVFEVTDLNLPILDKAGPVFHTITIEGDEIVGDLDVDLQITHPWVGDLRVTLEHNGTTVMLINQPGDPTDLPGAPFGCAEGDYDIILDDEGTGGNIEDVCEADLSSPPNYVPNEALAAFNGMSRGGDWTLGAEDVDPDAVLEGVLLGWSLHIQGAGFSCDAGCGSCPTDVSGDNNTGPLDLATLLGAWGPTDPGNCLDANGDLVIGPLDLATLLGAWGPCL